MLTDVRYAINQLRGIGGIHDSVMDRTARALNALECVEAKLIAQQPQQEEPAVNPRKPTFEQWLDAINEVLSRRIGLSHRDLPDCCYRDWYDDGVTARSAAARAIRNAKES